MSLTIGKGIKLYNGLMIGTSNYLVDQYIFGIRMFSQKKSNYQQTKSYYIDYGDYVVYSLDQIDSYDPYSPVVSYNNHYNNTRHSLAWSVITMSLYSNGQRAYSPATKLTKHSQSYFQNIIDQIPQPFTPISGMFTRTGSVPLTEVRTPNLTSYGSAPPHYRSIQIDIIGATHSGVVYLSMDNNYFELTAGGAQGSPWNNYLEINFYPGNNYKSCLLRIDSQLGQEQYSDQIDISTIVNGVTFYQSYNVFGFKVT